MFCLERQLLELLDTFSAADALLAGCRKQGLGIQVTQQVTAVSSRCRHSSLQVRGLQQGLHAALLSGVAPEEDPRRAAAVRLQAEEGQAVRVRGLRLHWPHAGGPVPARQRRPPRQRLPEENLQKTRCCSANQTEPCPAEELQRGWQGRVTQGLTALPRNEVYM